MLRVAIRTSSAPALPPTGECRRAAVLASQRGRLLKAVAEVAAERGLRGTTTTEVTRRAGISRTAFAQHFDDLDECFLAMLDWTVERGVEVTAEAFRREDAWDDGVIAGLEALLGFLDSEPVAARACLLEGMTALSERSAVAREGLGRLGGLIDETARRQLPANRQPPGSMPEGMLVSVLGMLRRRLLKGEVPPFVGVLGQLTEVAVASYMGPGPAMRSAGKARARAGMLLAGGADASGSARVEIPAMLRHGSSYRLRSCLQYLDRNPQASNQAIGEGIGISHSGQLSTLLARLYDGGLLVKDCGGAGRPNAWCLTLRGMEVTRLLTHSNVA